MKATWLTLHKARISIYDVCYWIIILRSSNLLLQTSGNRERQLSGNDHVRGVEFRNSVRDQLFFASEIVCGERGRINDKMKYISMLY